MQETKIQSRQSRAARTHPASRPKPIVQRYELLEEIARGGMGVVYRARDKASGQVVALKALTASDSSHAEQLTRWFEREYQVLRGLDHPRIIEVYDYGVTEDGAYYTMELLEGDDLASAAPIPWRETCRYLRDVATSLALLHARKLVHRDLSPNNVRRTPGDHCKLIDFGALTDFGPTDVIVGTPPLVAPEALDVGHLDQRADLYALGALAYYCLTGEHAYACTEIAQLPAAWDHPPPPPSSLVADIPPELDELVMALLSQDPLGRPSSAAEVIMRLVAMAQLPPEDDASQRLLVQSFLAAPTYVGHERELAQLDEAIRRAVQGEGRALRVVASTGAGRTRLLDEVAVRAQVAGAVVVRADASAHGGQYGLVRSLTLSMLDSLPELAREVAVPYRKALSSLGGSVTSRLRKESAPPVEVAVAYQKAEGFSSRPARRRSVPPSAAELARARSSAPPQVDIQMIGDRAQAVEGWILEISRAQPVVLLVDNLKSADDASLGTLIALARAARRAPLLLVLTERADGEQRRAFGLDALHGACDTLNLENLTLDEMVELMRSLFGDAPRVGRLADWVHAETAGCPLHGLGMLRELVAQGSIRNEHGAWVLPATRPETHIAGALEDALSRRIEALSAPALELARGLALHRSDATMELCRLLVPNREGDPDAPDVLCVLDELIATDVLRRDSERFSFSSAALRQTVLHRMDDIQGRLTHRRLGEALSTIASRTEDLALTLDAGWHLIRGGDEMRGADMIAEVSKDTMACNVLVANLYRIGEPMEAALRVYRAARKSDRMRLPLLSALAQAGYHEHYRWAFAYGDEALDVIQRASGLGLAHRLAPFVGRHLALAIGMGLAVITYYLSPRRCRTGSFIQFMEHTCAVVTSMCGVAAMSLDADRCERVAGILAPMNILPRRLALVSVYHFCLGLSDIGREHQAQAFERFDEFAKTFAIPGYYWLMPTDGHLIYRAASHFARGAFAMMRARGEAALESARALDQTGLPLYEMIASQVRYLYHLNRGEIPAAQVHRGRVEVHAARVGSAWQAEMWEPASLIPYYVATNDVVELSRTGHRLAELTNIVPSMWRYRELTSAVLGEHADPERAREVLEKYADETPRSYIGWATVVAVAAMLRNQAGEHAEARVLCERALATMNDADRECVMIFLLVDLQAAIADAGLGKTDEALARLDRLLAMHDGSGHGLTLGLLHDARARVAFAAGRRALFDESARQAGHWLRATGTPSLVAMCDRLVRLGEATPGSEKRNPLRGWGGISAEPGTRSRLLRQAASEAP